MVVERCPRSENISTLKSVFALLYPHYQYCITSGDMLLRLSEIH